MINIKGHEEIVEKCRRVKCTLSDNTRQKKLGRLYSGVEEKGVLKMKKMRGDCTEVWKGREC